MLFPMTTYVFLQILQLRLQSLQYWSAVAYLTCHNDGPTEEKGKPLPIPTPPPLAYTSSATPYPSSQGLQMFGESPHIVKAFIFRLSISLTTEGLLPFLSSSYVWTNTEGSIRISICSSIHQLIRRLQCISANSCLYNDNNRNSLFHGAAVRMRACVTGITKHLSI